MTPLELLDHVARQMKQTGRVVDWSIQKDLIANLVFGTLKIDSHTYDASEPLMKDHKYCRHKCATTLMLRARFDYSEIADALPLLPKYLPPLVFGDILAEHEGMELEFKSCRNASQPLSIQSLRNNLRQEIGRTICGMLNSQGGVLYVGIHGSGIIQGIDFRNREAKDSEMLAVNDHLRTKFEPDICGYYVAEDIEVLDEPSSTAQPPVCSSEEYQKYVTRLEARLAKLETLMKSPDSSRYLYVLRYTVTADKDKDKVFCYDRRFYYRHYNQTIEMPYDMMVRRIRAMPYTTKPTADKSP